MFAYHALRRHEVLPSHYTEFVIDTDQEGVPGADLDDQEEEQQEDGDPEKQEEEAAEEDYAHRTMTEFEDRLAHGDPQKHEEE